MKRLELALQGPVSNRDRCTICKIMFYYLILHNSNYHNNYPGKQKSVLTGTTLSRDLEEQKQHDRLKAGN